MSWTVGRIIFFTVVGLIAAGVHVYLYRHYVRAIFVTPLGRRIGKWVLVVLAVAGIVARPIARAAPDRLGGAMLLAVLIWLGTAIYLFLVAITFDVVRLIAALVQRARAKREAEAAERPAVDADRRRLLTAGVATGAAALAGGISLRGTWHALEGIRVVELPVRLPRLPRELEGLSIAHLTDIHVGAIIQSRFVRELVTRTNALRPDLVAITGDLVDGTVSQLGQHVAQLQGLQSRFGTFFVTGNHDHYSGADEWVAALQGLGVQVLRNRTVQLGDAGASIDLIGVDDYGSPRATRRSYDLGRAIAGRDPERASVLLAHQPQGLEQVAAAGLGLQISGHTHGGQMFPATEIGRLIWGERNAGLSMLGRTQLFVSRGCGFVGPPMRVGAPAEIVKLILLPA